MRHAEPLPKDSEERRAAFDSASANYNLLYEVAPADAHDVKQNSIYNAAVIANNQGDYKKAAAILDKGVAVYSQNKELQSLCGQTKYQAGDYAGAIASLRKAVELDAKEVANHQFLFLAYLKQDKKEESAAEYAIYKALSGGKQRVANDLKKWVDAADNRLGPSNQLKATLAAEGYPDEVYNFTEDGKTFESWFYWGKGKSVTFMEGQLFSKGTFPAQKPQN
jgi:tetratricopeptide (TPR) repeat protein